MKIKRLTAALAVAAMAAGFTLASPMLSANATTPPGTPADLTAAQLANIPALPPEVTIPGGQTSMIDVWGAITTDPAFSGITGRINDPYGNGWSLSLAAIDSAYVSVTPAANVAFTWVCTKQTAPSIVPVTGTALANLGSVTCGSDGQIYYTPNPAMGAAGIFQVTINYQIIAKEGPAWVTTFGSGPLTLPVIFGQIVVNVGPYATPNACTYAAKCLTADVQAYAKKAKATSVTVELLTPNALKPDGTGFVTGNGIWGLAAINNPDSNDKTLSYDTLMGALKTLTYGVNSNTVTFTPPAPNWSGTVTYEYVLASYATGVADDNNLKTGSLTFTVHPTLTAQDPIVSDQGVAVSVPVISQPPIGSAAFANAKCVFASSKSKTTLTDVGTISNKSSKDPVFTPTADFVGSTDVSCTVQDKWGITSNTITVTIQVGAAAPAVPAAPASPACGNGCNDGKLVSTGGSLATPMSSGLAAVVLLVAAGAGILVVRRRTSLAG